MRSARRLACATAIAALFACTVTNAAQRAFVSSTGSDANVGTGCLLTGPCRTFQTAHAAVDPGGEILALDGAGFGAVTITKSVSIIANPGVYAGISAASGNAVTVATAAVNVRLSGIKMNGLGATNGISMTNGASLTVENCTIAGFTSRGIEVLTAATVRVVDSLFTNNVVAGLYLTGGAKADVVNSRFFASQAGVSLNEQTTAGTVTTAAITGSIASRNNYGFLAVVNGVASTVRMSIANSVADGNTQVGIDAFNSGGTVTVVVGSSKVTQNGSVGLLNTASTFNSAGNNIVNDNGANTAGTITNVGTL